MQFGDFLFPDSRDPERDGIVIDETLAEAQLADRLGIDAIWLAEHHFDGICAYADPITIAGALAATTSRATLGFAVLQTALHHPIRLAEQCAILDNILKGRLIVGLGRGSSFNIYDYQGFGLDHREAQDRLEEAEAVMIRAWTEGEFAHRGRFWQLQVPMLRPRPYSRPHPPVVRGASTEGSMLALARQGRPFLMNVQSIAVTRERFALYRRTMQEAGWSDDQVATSLRQCWVWRNVFVADSDREAARVGIPAFQQMIESRAELRNRIYRDTGQRIEVPQHDLPSARGTVEHGFIHGSPPTVAAAMAEIAELGIGGVIATFRFGSLPHAAAADSLGLFMREVAPEFRDPQAARV